MPILKNKTEKSEIVSHQKQEKVTSSERLRETVNEVKSESEPHETGNVIEEVVDLARQINSEVYIDDVQELLDSNNQELIIDELVDMNKQNNTLKKNF
ncbi:hypothetical protein TNCV_486141 [Trichonephila clavipes]|nr:hypothetical protein TNCV_486141 [Trichonephila clavipes]